MDPEFLMGFFSKHATNGGVHIVYSEKTPYKRGL
jgi:hypothetical protein